MLEQYQRIGKAIGVSITVLQNGSLEVDACEITVERKQLTIGKKVTGLSSLGELKKHFPSKSFLSLNLTGKGILQKQVEKTEDISQHNFNRILPNANIADFYVQHFLSGNQSFVSVIRKTDADQWIAHLKGLDFIPLMLSLGPFPVQQIVPQLNVYDQELIFNGHIIQRNEQSEWTAYNYNDSARSQFPLKAESEPISEKLLIPYGAAFQLVLVPGIAPIQAGVPELQTALDTVIANKKLQVKGALVLAVFFILLLANFILLTSLNSSNITLSDQLSRSNQSSVDLQAMNDQTKQKQALLQELGWDGGIDKSALIDQIASLLPEEITWKEMAINPIDINASREQRSLVFADREIQVTGNSSNILPVNEWIARVKTKAWVKNVQMDSYTFNSEINTGQFTITINY